MNRAASTILLVCAALVGTLAWSIQLREPLVPHATGLDGLPREVGSWRSTDLSVDEVVESELRATHNLQRRYDHPLGEIVWLYVGYYGTERGGVPEHTPTQCYGAQGWATGSSATLRVAGAEHLEVNEMEVEHGDARRLVHFWYRTHGGNDALTTFGLRLAQVRGRLQSGRGDGALIRLSTPLEASEDLPAARQRLFALERELDPALNALWPDERVDGA